MQEIEVLQREGAPAQHNPLMPPHQPVPLDTEVRWIHGSPSPRHLTDPPLQVHHLAPGTVLFIDVRGTRIPATVTTLPFYRRNP